MSKIDLADNNDPFLRLQQRLDDWASLLCCKNQRYRIIEHIYWEEAASNNIIGY